MAQSLVGTVVSAATPKTVSVLVISKKRHPRYQKVMTTSKKHKAHVTNMEIAVGDMVQINACRPLSKTKHFIVVKKVETK
jgi:small subunit ribosomal protein S17